MASDSEKIWVLQPRVPPQPSCSQPPPKLVNQVKRKSKICAVYGCNNYQEEKKHSFFRFPKDPERLECLMKKHTSLSFTYFHFRCQRWVVNTRRDDLIGKPHIQLFKNHMVCSVHFEDSQFMNASLR